jgi:hypothetical protein
MSLIPLALLPIVAILELLGWFSLHPLYLRLALLPLKQDVPFPQVHDTTALRQLKGSSENLSWRWDEALGALVFRRELRFLGGRKAYFFGRIVWDPEGNSRVQWAPFPLLVYPVMVIAMPFFMAIEDPDSALFAGLVAMPVVLVVAGLNGLFSSFAVKNLIHELETTVMDELAARDAL